MADEPGTDAFSVWLRRVGPVIEAVNKIGLTTFLIIIVVFIGGVALGYLPLKPFDDLSTEHQTLARSMGDTENRQKVESTRTTEMLERLTVLLARMDRRAQLIDCARLIDPDLRKRCLE